MKKQLLLFYLIFTSLLANADVKIGQFWYELDYDNKTAEIESANPHTLAPYNNLKEVIIPEKIEYNDIIFTVTSIGENAFRNTSLTKISLPNTIEAIKERAFSNCNIERIEIPEKLSFIGYSVLALVEN